MIHQKTGKQNVHSRRISFKAFHSFVILTHFQPARRSFSSGVVSALVAWFINKFTWTLREHHNHRWGEGSGRQGEVSWEGESSLIISLDLLMIYRRFSQVRPSCSFIPFKGTYESAAILASSNEMRHESFKVYSTDWKRSKNKEKKSSWIHLKMLLPCRSLQNSITLKIFKSRRSRAAKWFSVKSG